MPYQSLFVREETKKKYYRRGLEPRDLGKKRENLGAGLNLTKDQGSFIFPKYTRNLAFHSKSGTQPDAVTF